MNDENMKIKWLNIYNIFEENFHLTGLPSTPRLQFYSFLIAVSYTHLTLPTIYSV